MLPISESFLANEYSDSSLSSDRKINLPIKNIYEINSTWIAFLDSNYESFEEFIKTQKNVP